ncbi:hypothetical protein BDZ91DRAFT_696403 [Kalaharituber pfeilii]|nr:hypothetical protein BDZ91DRAFT_696403 [Kalaharituber pfeilii]
MASASRTIMEIATEFNFDILESEFFKITLVEDQKAPGTRSVFYAHKELLASLSPELRRHIHNEMKEGLSGEMVLHDVDKDTVQCFLQWAYIKEYTVDCQEMGRALLLHIKLYILADRFNITSLKDLSFGKLTALCTEGLKPDPRHAALVLSATKYAVDNLPAVTERLIAYLLGYIAWTLDKVHDLAEFTELIQAHPDVAVALFHLNRPAEQPPWKKEARVQNTATSFILACQGCNETATIAHIFCTRPSCRESWNIKNWDKTDRNELRCRSCKFTGSLEYYCANAGCSAGKVRSREPGRSGRLWGRVVSMISEGKESRGRGGQTLGKGESR